MKKWEFVGIVAAIIFFGFYFCFRGPNVKNYPPRNNKIIIFGDSLAFGQGATSGNDIASQLSRKLKGVVINMGQNGNTTSDALVRLEKLIAQKPGIVIISLGGNDFIRSFNRSFTEKNLSTIIEQLQDEGIVVILLGVRDPAIIDKASAMYKRLSKKYRTAYVSNILATLIGDNRYMSDAIHPNDAGYTKIVERLYPVVVDLLNDRKE
jgi:lysophospholipase L1-like esterase